MKQKFRFLCGLLSILILVGCSTIPGFEPTYEGGLTREEFVNSGPHSYVRFETKCVVIEPYTSEQHKDKNLCDAPIDSGVWDFLFTFDKGTVTRTDRWGEVTLQKTGVNVYTAGYERNDKSMVITFQNDGIIYEYDKFFNQMTIDANGNRTKDDNGLARYTIHYRLQPE